MSRFIQHIKIATENIVLLGGPGTSKKEQYEYAEKMEKMLKRQLKEELEEIAADKFNIEENLWKFINKI
jgi:hypothetical protein